MHPRRTTDATTKPMLKPSARSIRSEARHPGCGSSWIRTDSAVISLRGPCVGSAAQTALHEDRADVAGPEHDGGAVRVMSGNGCQATPQRTPPARRPPGNGAVVMTNRDTHAGGGCGQAVGEHVGQVWTAAEEDYRRWLSVWRGSGARCSSAHSRSKRRSRSDDRMALFGSCSGSTQVPLCSMDGNGST